MPNPEVLENADPAILAAFDAVIDVRSPGEFAQDHVPGAINLPVLDNEERAVVGTLYVQQSRFGARRLGAAMVARNVAHHLETALADKPGGFRPLVYCWRGGQRSGAMATILAQVGWRVAVLAGGYKTYRRRVRQRLYDEDLGLDLVLLDGPTGSGKTEVLRRLAAMGLQTLDLEALAEHRGSLFGGLAGQPQPGQKMFESRLLSTLGSLDPARPVVVEAESSKIGDLMNPPALWAAMLRAPRIELAAPAPERARSLVEAYADFVADRTALKAALARLPPRLGRKRLADLAAQADAGDFAALAESLIELHYDPAYARSSRKDTRPRLGRVELDQLDPAALDAAAGSVAELVEAARRQEGTATRRAPPSPS